MILKLFLVQFVLLYLAGLTFIGGRNGIIGAAIVLSLLNYIVKYTHGFIFWQLIIAIYALTGLLINGWLNTRTNHLRLVKVSVGSIASLLTSGLLMPIIPAFLAWSVLLGIPLGFTYREIGKPVMIHMIFRFIFSGGWIIIGNILIN